ncbi:cysteine-rich KTR domain-containing protein [Hungatella effluvii]|uniref:cysteine-rich KTR domain-containing protein n=1 Tax=Hungatella TaxID=1649459 RepID=UPI003D80F62C
MGTQNAYSIKPQGEKSMIDRMVWFLCPVCGNKTRLKVRQDTELINFPLLA